MKLTKLTPELFHFLEDATLLPHPILIKVAEETSKLPDSMMQIPKHQGAFMYLLTKIMNVQTAIEVGCYTGYSAISVAAALSGKGKLTTFDIDPKTSTKARQYFEEANLSHCIELRLGLARDLLKLFFDEQPKESIDLAFIDADKVGYDTYYELCLGALRKGGVILLDNAFRDGEILAPAVKDLGTQTVAKLIKKTQSDSRVEAAMLPIADGLYLIRKL